MIHGREKIRIEELNDTAESFSEMIRDVRMGLLDVPKGLSPWPKYFYDERGSKLFEEIMALPEYYQARVELSILHEMADEIVERARYRELIELGSGSASKTRALLDAMPNTSGRSGGALRHVPLDVSESVLRGSAKRLLEEYPGLEISGFVGDFDR